MGLIDWITGSTYAQRSKRKNERRDDRNDNREDRRDEREDRVDSRQDGRTDRTEIRQEERSYRTELTGKLPGEDAWAAAGQIGGAAVMAGGLALGAGAGGLPGFTIPLGGGGSSSDADEEPPSAGPNPLLIGLGVVAVAGTALLLFSKD